MCERNKKAALAALEARVEEIGNEGVIEEDETGDEDQREGEEEKDGEKENEVCPRAQYSMFIIEQLYQMYNLLSRRKILVELIKR